MMIWSFAFVGSASHWSAGPPAAAIWSYLSPGQKISCCQDVRPQPDAPHWLSTAIQRARTPLGALQSKLRADEMESVSFHGKCQLLCTQ